MLFVPLEHVRTVFDIAKVWSISMLPLLDDKVTTRNVKFLQIANIHILIMGIQCMYYWTKQCNICQGQLNNFLTYLGTKIATSALSVQSLAQACRAVTASSKPVRRSQIGEPDHREIRRDDSTAKRSVTIELAFCPCALAQSFTFWILSDTVLDPGSSVKSTTVLLNSTSVSTVSVTVIVTSLAALECHTISPCIYRKTFYDSQHVHQGWAWIMLWWKNEK